MAAAPGWGRGGERWCSLWAQPSLDGVVQVRLFVLPEETRLRPHLDQHSLDSAAHFHAGAADWLAKRERFHALIRLSQSRHVRARTFEAATSDAEYARSELLSSKLHASLLSVFMPTTPIELATRAWIERSVHFLALLRARLDPPPPSDVWRIIVRSVFTVQTSRFAAPVEVLTSFGYEPSAHMPRVSLRTLPDYVYSATGGSASSVARDEAAGLAGADDRGGSGGCISAPATLISMRDDGLSC